MDKENLLQANLEWVQQVEDRKFFRTEYNGEKLLLRLNDFPEEPLYSVIGESSFDLDDKPETWLIRYLDEQ